MNRLKSNLASTILTALVLMLSIITNAQSNTITSAPANDAIRPFRVHISTRDLADLKHRILQTRWPDKETVVDQSQGIKLEKLQSLLQYWSTKYDWSNVEAKLNVFPQFITNIDGVDIHFIHVRSREPGAMPLIISHGWPGSIFELLKIINPLTNPKAYAGKPQDAFDVVIPSLPGFGFSGRPTEAGWGPERIAHAWDVLMKRLGYERYVAQGGDWGAAITLMMGRQAPTGLLGIHLNLVPAVPTDVAMAIAVGAPAPAGISEEERKMFETLSAYTKKGFPAYNGLMTARPQAIGYGLTDSPAGLAAWMLVHPGFFQWIGGPDPGKLPTMDDVLNDITLYWLTNSAVSSARLYWENAGKSLLVAAPWKTNEITVPVAVTVFGEDTYRPPESWVRRAYPSLSYFHEVPKGGHFAAWEQPVLFTEEIRAAFKSLR